MTAADTLADASAAPAGARSFVPSRLLWRPTGFFLLLTLFFLVHWLLRPWLTATAGSDDADQLLFSQALRLGYAGDQQPLYSWLLWALAQLLGPTILAAALLKYGLVFLIHTFSYLLAGQLRLDPRLRLVAGFAPMLIYPLGWRLHEADTHGVLGCVLVMAMFWAAHRLADRRRLADYLLLGLVFGLGLSTSLFFALGIAALLVAGRRHPGLTDRRILLSILIGLLLVAPHLAWLAENWQGALREFDIRLRGLMRRDHLTRLADHGLVDWLVALALSMFPLWLGIPLLFPQLRHRLAPRVEDGVMPSVPLYLAAVALLLLAVVLALGISNLPQYRVYFLFLPLIPYLFWRIDRNGFEPRQLRWILILLGVVFVMVVQLRIQQIFVGPAYCKTCRLQAPYPAIGAGLTEAGYGGGGLILADDEYVAGNMRVQFPDAVVLSARYPLFQPTLPTEAAECLAVWDADNVQYTMPNRLKRLIRSTTGLEMTGDEPSARIAAMVPHSDTPIAPRREILIGYSRLHDGGDRCP